VRRLDEQGRSPFWQAIKRQSYELLQLERGAAVLDVGCGTGNDALALAAIVGPTGRVVGIDCSTTMLEVANRRSQDGHLPVRFMLGNAEELDFPESAA
jgi:ubiquinone/menaquinone biosynthesis C-methylase UbiE